VKRLGRWLFLPIPLAVVAAITVSRMRPVPVAATPVVRGKAIDAVYATGTVEAEDRVQVKAKILGSVAEVFVKEGAQVKKGDLLARIDNPVVRFDLKRGQADLSAASAQAGPAAPQLASLKGQWKATDAELTAARSDWARVEKLVASGSVSSAEGDRSKAKVAQLEGMLAANEAQQRALAIDLSANAARQGANVQSLASRAADTEVRAPLDGVVLTKSVELGEVVAVNQPLFKVGNVKRLVLEVSVDEADISRVEDGRGGRPASAAAVSLYAFPREVFRGRVFEVLPDANRDRKVFVAKVELEAPPPGLRSGMSAEVNIVASTKEGALLAPTEAIEEGKVWLVQGGVLARRAVKVGVRDLLRVEILEGLAEGDQVVVSGADKAGEGKRVTVELRLPDRLQPMPDLTQPHGGSL
jgi:multidrug efflux pump subunit AcrA (membrane-fusion protein)